MKFVDDRGNPTVHSIWAAALFVTVLLHVLIFSMNYYPWLWRQMATIFTEVAK